MSAQEETPVVDEQSPDVQAALQIHVAQVRGEQGNPLPSISVRQVNEPCAKHAKDPPGAQVMNDDGTRQRDPNGYTYGCPDCTEEMRVEA